MDGPENATIYQHSLTKKGKRKYAEQRQQNMLFSVTEIYTFQSFDVVINPGALAVRSIYRAYSIVICLFAISIVFKLGFEGSILVLI